MTLEKTTFVHLFFLFVNFLFFFTKQIAKIDKKIKRKIQQFNRIKFYQLKNNYL